MSESKRIEQAGLLCSDASSSVVLSYLQVLRANCGHVCYSQDEADRVENVRLSTAVEAGDRVEALVPGLVSESVAMRTSDQQ